MNTSYHDTQCAVQLFLYPPTKICRKCDPPTEKSIDAFGIDTSRKDGHTYVCKECLCKFAHSRYIPQHTENKQKPGKKAKPAREGFKWCNKCVPPAEKPLEAFSKRSDTYDGRSTACKECDSERHQKASPEVVARGRARTKQWFQAHPGKFRYHGNLRRARKKHAETSDPVNYERILERDGYWCYICEKPIEPHHQLHFDHVTPLTPRRGTNREPGPHCEENIKPTHMICNCRKHTRLLSEMTPFQRRGPD